MNNENNNKPLIIVKVWEVFLAVIYLVSFVVDFFLFVCAAESLRLTGTMRHKRTQEKMAHKVSYPCK